MHLGHELRALFRGHFLVITNSILPSNSVKNAHNIRVLPIASLLGEAIARTAEEQSVSSLFY